MHKLNFHSARSLTWMRQFFSSIGNKIKSSAASILSLTWLNSFSLKNANNSKQGLDSATPADNSAEILVKIAVTSWQLQKKLNNGKDKDEIKETSYEKCKYSVERIINQLSELEITVNSRQGQKYNDGMNIDVMARVGNAEFKNELIKETMEPEVLLRGKIIKKEKVIIEYVEQTH